MRIHLSPFLEWGTRRRVWLRQDRLANAAGVPVVVHRRMLPSENRGRPGWAVSRVGTVTRIAENGEVDIAWDQGFERDAGWADLLDFGYLEFEPDCHDVSDDPTTYVPSEWRLNSVVVLTQAEAVALAEILRIPDA